MWVSGPAEFNLRGLQGTVQLLSHMKDEMNAKWNLNLTRVHWSVFLLSVSCLDGFDFNS